MNTCSAQDLTILYTGSTQAMLYPCHCPKEADGGVARRATLIKELRKENPDVLLLDSGGFFARGLTDEHAQNIELDKARTLVNLKAMQLMQYDALALGEEEFNFGREFLPENLSPTKIPLLSCNLSLPKGKSDWFKPYLIKEIAGFKIGIIAARAFSRHQAGGHI